MAQTRLKSGNLHMVGGDNGSDGNVLKSKGDGTMEWGATVVNPTFTSFDYPGDDTALDPAGGQSLVINGSGFGAGVTVTIGGTTSSSITLNSATQLTVTTPAKSAGSQTLAVINTDGGSASTNVSYNGIPAFTNAAGSLASVKSGATISVSAVATEPDGGAITYAITSGSLPSGATLNTSTGAITGTAPDVSASTTSNFTVTATDNENQSTARAYSITIVPPFPSEHFGIVTYTGNASTRSFTGLGFKPDLVLTKSRSYAEKINVFDSTRGVTKRLYLTDTHSEATQADSLTSFDNDGWSIGNWGDMNQNSQTYVSWCFKANGGTTSSNTDGTITSTVQTNPTLGFSIMQYTGTGSNATVGHNLSSAPEFVIVKKASGVQNWMVGTDAIGWTKYLELNQNNAEATASTTWNNTAPTATTVSLGSSNNGNNSGGTYIMYAFTSVDGFSKFGSYTGNGNANGPIIETGFEPAFIMVKRYNATSNWVIYDNKRNTTNPRYSYLMANETSAEAGSAGDAAPQLDFFSNGFRPSGTEGYVNADEDSYIYMAFAQDADTTSPTLADSFSTEAYTGNSGTNAITGVGFQPDLVWTKARNQSSYSHFLTDSTRGGTKVIQSNSTAAEITRADNIQSFDSDGFTLGADGTSNYNGTTYVAWNWKADDNEPTILHETSDAVAVYKFEDNGDDVTGNYNGTETGITYTTGKFNKAASFNGTTSRILNTSFNAITGNAARSYNAWAYTDGSTAGALVCTGQWGVGGRSIALYIDQSINRFKAYGYSASYDADLGTLPTLSNGWHMFTLSWDGSSVFKAYIDGELVSTTIKNATYNTTSYLCIGDWYDATLGVYHYENLIDQVRVYAGVLTPDSITNLYNETLSQNSTLDIGTKLDGVKQSIVSANTNAGFSIVKFEKQFSSSVAENIPHGLSAAPEMIILKRTDGVEDWYVYHTSLGNAARIQLNSDAAQTTGTNVWGQTNPTATQFTVESFNAGNAIAYCFHSVSGYSKFGSYTGTGSSTRSFTGLGFQPDYVMVKSATQSGARWQIYDSVRGVKQLLLANTDAAEYNEASSGSAGLNSFDSDGWTIGNDGHMNGSGATYIYMAIKIN